MPLDPPKFRRFVPPSPEEVVASQAAAAQVRAGADAAREAAQPARRAVLLAGPALRDVDAAVDCRCACHPRPADVTLHGGGVSCACQRTEADAARREASDELWSAMADEIAEEERFYAERRERFDAEAETLDVEARIEVWAAPFVTVGVCDGRGFYLRERHGAYRVTIAPDEDPGSDPWTAEPTQPSIDIASGDDAELHADGDFSPAIALRVAVRCVRAALARNSCAHRRV